MTYFRVQPADLDVDDLLNPEHQFSHHWNEIDSEEYTRRGVSTCESLEDLAAYLAGSGIPIGDGEWVIVELDGDISDDTPYDADYGEVLIHPTEIVSVRPMDDEFFTMISDAYDAAHA